MELSGCNSVAVVRRAVQTRHFLPRDRWPHVESQPPTSPNNLLQRDGVSRPRSRAFPCILVYLSPSGEPSAWTPTGALSSEKTAALRRFLMELAGLEPATSWVRSRFGRARPFHCSSSHLTNHRVSRDFQPFMPSRLHSASRPVALHLCQKRVTSSCLTCQRACLALSERRL
jgi:hypothetical protein